VQHIPYRDSKLTRLLQVCVCARARARVCVWRLDIIHAHVFFVTASRVVLAVRVACCASERTGRKFADAVHCLRISRGQ